MRPYLSVLPVPASQRVTVAHLMRDDTYGLMRHAHNLEILDGVRNIFVGPATASGSLQTDAFVSCSISRRPSWNTVREARRIAEELRPFRADLIHAHSVATLPAAMVISRSLGVPLVHSPHALPVRGLSGSPVEVAVAHGLIRLAASRGVSFVAVAANEADSLKRVAGPRASVELVVNPVPPRYLDRWPAGGRHQSVLSLSRFWKQKSPLLMVDVVAALEKYNPEARLAWAGDGPLLEECRSRAASAGVLPRIDFLGPVPDSLPLLHQSAVMLTTSSFEAMPYAVLEAMAAGAAVVATDIPAHREINAGHGALALCQPDADELARAINRLLSDDLFHARQRMLARRLVEEQHSVALFQEKMVRFYRRIAGWAEDEAPAQEAETLVAA
jgi:glycosyltransferase involved in cell wall biosynthesis